MDSKTIKKAIEFLKKADVPQDSGFFAYCEKHLKVHSSLQAEKDCFESFKRINK